MSVELSVQEYANEAWRQGLPFFTPGAIEFMESVVSPEFKAFEWGAGASTVWLARNVAQTVSVEHQQEWCDQVLDRLCEEELTNTILVLVRDVGSCSYFSAISCYPDGFFDLVLVDGRNRVMCIRSALAKVKPGGYLILDNSERPRYRDGIALLETWERQDFPSRWVTSIFRRLA